MIIIKTILVTQTNELVNTTPKECIMQRSKLVDSLHFLVEPDYKGKDMSTFTVLLEYVLPVSKKYSTEILTLSPERYENMLEYTLPFDTQLTKEAGDIEMQLTFSKIELSTSGKPKQMVRKTKTQRITISPIAAWSDLIPDEALTPLDQRILKQDAQIKELNEIAEHLNMSKADNLSYNQNTLQLLSNGEKIGDAVTITSSGGSAGGDEGFDIVEF